MQKLSAPIAKLPEQSVLIFKAGCSKDCDECWADFRDLSLADHEFFYPDAVFIGQFAELNAKEYLAWRNKEDTS